MENENNYMKLGKEKGKRKIRKRNGK